MSIISKIITTLKNRLQGIAAFRRRIEWLLLTIFSLCGMIDIPGSALIPMPATAAFVIILFTAMFKGGLLTATLELARPVRWLSLTVRALVAVYCILCAINALGYTLFDTGITIKMITVLGQTNPAEIKEFLPTLMTGIGGLIGNPLTYVWIFAAAGCAGVLKLASKRVYLFILEAASAVGLVSFISLFFLLSIGRSNSLMTFRIINTVVYAHKEMRLIQEEMSKLTPLPNPDTVSSSCLTDIIMVVGESANRSNLSLYGYELPTTPELDKLKSQLIIFTDVIGSSVITYSNMNRILTFLPEDEPSRNWWKHPRLFSLMKQAGYHTAWLSNQEKSGIWGSNIAALVADADDVRFIGATSSHDVTFQRYDELLLPELDQAVQNGGDAKFIGVHLMGSHLEYRRRYPKKFGHFTAADILSTQSGKQLTAPHAAVLAEYDNSLLYTDSLLASMINRISDASRPTLLIYFSDHGENVYDDGGDYRGRDDKHVEVPFIIYPNHAFAEAYPGTVERLKAVRHNPMNTANLCHLLCTLTGTSYYSYDPSCDISSPHYSVRGRYVDFKPWKYEHLGGR